MTAAVVVAEMMMAMAIEAAMAAAKMMMTATATATEMPTARAKKLAERASYVFLRSVLLCNSKLLELL